MELTKAISEDISKEIEYYYSDIGEMNRLKMRFSGDLMKQWSDYFIRYDMEMIAGLRGDQFRHEKRLSELRRTGPGRASVGTGVEVCERAGLFNQPKIWSPYP
jgi:hypothetical protein